MNIIKTFKKNKVFFINNRILFFVTLVFIFLVSFEVSFAAETFRAMVERLVSTTIKPIGSLFASAAVATFLFGVARYMKGGEIGKEGARDLMVWGIIGITVISAVWGFVAALRSTLGV